MNAINYYQLPYDDDFKLFKSIHKLLYYENRKHITKYNNIIFTCNDMTLNLQSLQYRLTKNRYSFECPTFNKNLHLSSNYMEGIFCIFAFGFTQHLHEP